MLRAFLLLYYRPAAAVSRTLDYGRLWFGIVLSLGVSLLLHVRDFGPAQPADQGAPAPPALIAALWRWLGAEPSSFIAPLGALAFGLIPAILFFRAVSGYGSFGVLMRSEYLTLLLCGLMCWSAAYLPLAVLNVLGIAPAWLFFAASAGFCALMVVAVRTAVGAELAPSIGMTAAGWAAGIGALALYDVTGPVRYYVMSPFVLYYAYALFSSDVRSLGEGLRSRQHLRRQLEIATTNPRDADAHYQIGLIYQKRRQFAEAVPRFERAVAIDPHEADPHLQLGRIALEQGRFEDAVGHLSTAASLDDRLSQHEVWRDLGAALLGAGRAEEAAGALTKYVSRREYDPEGLYWHGMAQAKLGQTATARDAFAQCMEAVKTMPPHRRAHVRRWGRQAKAAMAKL